MTEKDLNEQITRKFDILKKSNNIKLESIHFKSVKNFKNYLLKDNGINSVGKSNIKSLGKIQKKELLLEYLIEIEKQGNKTPKSLKLSCWSASITISVITRFAPRSILVSVPLTGETNFIDLLSLE